MTSPDVKRENYTGISEVKWEHQELYIISGNYTTAFEQYPGVGPAALGAHPAPSGINI